MDWQAATVEAGRIAQAWTAEGGPGGAVLLFDADDIRAEACGGLASLELAMPFRTDTVVRYASISKHFLAALVLREGFPGLDDFLGTHLAVQPALGAVTVGRALDMTGGLPDAMETLWLLGVPPGVPMDHGALLAFLQRLDRPDFAPGTEISYSNSGYRLVQAVLEAKGIDIADTLRRRFLRPLDLALRLPYDETEPVPGLAGGYWKSPAGWRRGRYGLHISMSGGLAGSGLDLAIWAQALMVGRGNLDGMLPKLARLRHLADGRPTGYGLGLARYGLGRRVLVGHGGSLPGFKSHFLIDAEARAGVVVVANREDADTATLALRVMAALHGVTVPGPARGILPEGLYAMPGTPFWLEHAGGVVTCLGAQETVYPEADDTVCGRSAHLPLRLTVADGAISGEVGHAPRRFVPVQAGLAPDPAWAGAWTCLAQNARLDVVVTGETAYLRIGAGALLRDLPLRPIGEGRALTLRSEGPWTQRACLQFTGGELRLVTSRSRTLRFTRAS
ncbi:Beta-lactamase family protein [Rhodovastum atsumiense]|nr:Beta-lactamase family protein [Rhodovastum atsumiense]